MEGMNNSKFCDEFLGRALMLVSQEILNQLTLN